MTCGRFICALLLLSGPALLAERRTPPLPRDHFELARHTFIDMGPPFDFYEIFVVRTAANGTSIQRLTLTPAGLVCLAPAKVEMATATLSESVTSLLGSKNPCTIPEKALRRELKRRKKGLVFSGADVVLSVPCGNRTRLIRADILDRDMFDAAPNTPENTSWTMRMLARLDQAIGGPGVLDKPIFSFPERTAVPRQDLDPATIEHLSAGEYDQLFSGAPDKPSELYRAAQILPALPTIRLLSVEPITPESSPMPEYPPLARLAQIEGSVSARMRIDERGNVTDITFNSGHPLLRRAVEDALRKWRFPVAHAHPQVQATIEFALNCHSPGK